LPDKPIDSFSRMMAGAWQSATRWSGAKRPRHRSNIQNFVY